MNIWTYLTGIAVSLIVVVTVIQMLRLGRLRERHGIWWLVAGLIVLVMTIFPQTLQWIADLLGVKVPLNLSLFLAIGVLVLLALQHSAELTAVERKIRALTEELALLRAELDASREGPTKGKRPGSGETKRAAARSSARPGTVTKRGQ